MPDEIAGALGLGEPYHIGITVRDIESAMTRLGELLGVGPWGRVDAEVEAVYRGKLAKCGVRAALARLGSMYIEVVEPTTEGFTAATFLREHGEGIYHIGFWVDDMSATIAKAEKAGLTVDWAFPAEHPFAVYLDAASTNGMHIELVHPAMKQVIEDAIARAGQTD